MQLLTVSPSPHVRSGMTTQKIMGLVLLALLPAAVCGVIFFGIRALLLMLFCILISMATEAICQKLMKKPVTISDGSAALTGLLLALNLPATLPLWKAAVGCIFAIAVVKQLFGGLGCNFANPAITGRVFLLLSFAGDMTTWVKPFYYHGLSIGNQLQFFCWFAGFGCGYLRNTTRNGNRIPVESVPRQCWWLYRGNLPHWHCSSADCS